MASPFVRSYLRPRSPDDYPTGPCFTAGHLVEINASWRSERPVLSVERCTGCLRCYLACPDGAVLRVGAAVQINYDFCKGCGICAHECSAQAILMIPEENKHAR